MHQEVAKIEQNPLRRLVTFHAVRPLPAGLQLEPHFIRDRLALFRVVARADDKVVGERGDAVQVEYLDVDGLFFFRRTNRNQPAWYYFFLRNFFFQRRLLKVIVH
jgi:hypothetical protein